MQVAVFAPVHDHAELRKRKSQKSSHGVKGNQFVRDAIEEDQQEKSEKREDHDAVGVNEAAATVAEGVRQIIVLGDGAAEAGKIGKRGVRGKRKNKKNAGNGDVVKNAFAKNGCDEHGEKALVAGMARVGGGNAIGFDEIRNPCKQNRQKKNDDGQRALRVFHARFAERFDAIADGFDAGKRRAAAGENFQEKPEGDGFGDGRWRGERRDRHGVAAAERNAHKPANDGDEERSDEEIGRNHEGYTGI